MVKPVIRWVAVLCMATILTVLSNSYAQAQVDAPVDDAQGALIVAVISDSPASEAGLIRGDVILAVGDQVVNSSADLRALVPEAAPGDVLPLTIRHGDETFIVDVELGDQDGRAFLGVYLARDLEEPAAEEPAADMAEEDAEPEEPIAEEAAAEEPLAEEPATEDAAPAEADAEATEQPAEESAGSIVVEEPAAEEPAAEAERAEPEAQATETPEAAEEPEEAEKPQESEEAGEAAPEVYGMIPYTDTAGGAILFAVMDGSPADEAGLQMGDLILGVDGERLQQSGDLADIVDERTPGQEMTLNVLRRTGEYEDVVVLLGEHPEEVGQAYLGIGFLPTPRRMFLGQGPHGDMLVPAIPFFWHGPDFDDPNDRLGPRPHPHQRWMPEGHPHWGDCEDGMPWWSCEDEDSDQSDDNGELEDKSDDSANWLLRPTA